MATTCLTGKLFFEMLQSGAANLELHSSEVNDLNVFPIPDGDTGSNMTLTVQGGASASVNTENLSDTASGAARGMLLSARGNSGVILSQLFEGAAAGLKGLVTADLKEIDKACQKAVEQAYSSVIDPTEGTILTVARETSEMISGRSFASLEEMLEAAIDRAKVSLEHTPELLDVLKKAGVVDSGGAGLIYILEGMYCALTGKAIERSAEMLHRDAPKAVNTDLFTEDSVLEFGYCTEVLVAIAPTTINEPNLSGAPSAINLNLQMSKRNTIMSPMPPKSPSSSHMIENIISFWASGINPSFWILCPSPLPNIPPEPIAYKP